MAPVVAALGSIPAAIGSTISAIPAAIGSMLPGAAAAVPAGGAAGAAATAGKIATTGATAAGIPLASKLIAARLLTGGGPAIEGGAPPPLPPLPSSPLSPQRRTSPFSSKPAGGELSPELMEALISLLQRQSFPSR